MTDRLALFPLGTVLFPGQMLPLHIFEERYRLLIRTLLKLPEGPARSFGVVAIREGREVGQDGIRALYDVGCTARVRRVERYDDGRFDIVTVGENRFALRGVDDSLPYFQGDVDLLPDEPGSESAELAEAIAPRFGAYLGTLRRSGTSGSVALPADERAMSYVVAAAMVLDLPDRQELLAAPNVAARLRKELALLRRETVLFRQLPSLPATGLSRIPYAAN